MNPFSPIFAKVFAALSAVLLIAVGIQSLRAAHFEKDRDRWHASFDAQKAAYIAAQEAATAKAIAAKIQTETRYADLARKADSLVESRMRLLSAADRYARANIVRPEAVGCTPGRTLTSSQGDPAEGGHGPRGAAELVAVSRNDFDLLVANSARLEDVRRWGESLVQEGLAVPAVEFGK